ncbi:MAG: hypothetical protein IKF99_21150 [Oscillospiraceae bacterium]|nr:hypothetical protein [Oscillospiraceae bacterium]
MASGRIKGITIEIDGNTTPLQRALAGVDKSLQKTNSALKDVNKLLKVDPGNVDLLRQKQEYLGRAIQDVKEKLKIEKEAFEQLKNADPSEENAEKQKILEREIIDTEQALKNYESQLDETERELQGVDKETGKAADSTDKLERETEQAEDAQDKANQGWTAARQVLADMVTRGIQLAIDAVKRLAKAMVEAVQDAGDFADEILTLSSQTGLATDTLQEFRYMAELIDVPVDTISGSLRKLTNNMQSAASGTGSAYEAFSALGVSVTDANGHLRRAEDVFYDTIDALGQMNNETERDAYSMDIFGRSAQDLNPLIEAGSDAIEDFAQEAHEMGYVLDGEALTALGDMDDSFERIRLQMEAVRNQIIVEMAPAIEEMANAFLEWARTVDWSEVAQKLGEVLHAVIEVVGFVIDHKEVVIAALVGIASAIAGATAAQWAMNAAMTANPIGLIITAVGGLTAALLVFEEKTGHVSWSWQVTIDAFRNSIERTKAVFERIIQNTVRSFQFLYQNFVNVIQGIKNIFASARDFIANSFTSAFHNVTSRWMDIGKFFSDKWERIKEAFNNVGEFFRSKFQAAYDAVTGIWSRITGFFANLHIQLPHIRLPHFNISGSFSLSPPRVPHLSVNWYDQGGIFTQPSIIGVGEKRPEFVGALDDLRKIVSEESGNQTINITVNAAAGQNENEIANLVMQKMQHAVNRKGAVYA